MQDKPSAIAYEIAHTTMGRIRIRIPQIKENPVYASHLEKLISDDPGVTDIRINQAAISVVVNYKPKVISDEAIALQLHNYIQQAGGVDPATVPFPLPSKAETETPVETEVESSGNTETPVETEVESSGNTVTPVETEAAVTGKETSENQSLEVSITTIESKEESKEESKKEVEKEAEEKPILQLNQKTLAKRLHVSITSLRQMRSQPDFASWSSAKDPEGKAWKYVAESGYSYEEILDK